MYDPSLQFWNRVVFKILEEVNRDAAENLYLEIAGKVLHSVVKNKMLSGFLERSYFNGVREVLFINGRFHSQKPTSFETSQLEEISREYNGIPIVIDVWQAAQFRVQKEMTYLRDNYRPDTVERLYGSSHLMTSKKMHSIN